MLGQEGDDILEVLMLPVEMREASASGMAEKDVEEVVESFRESGMPPGEAAAVLRFERTLSARRGLKTGFSAHVLQRLSDGAATTEVIASLREREATEPLVKEERERLKKAAARRAKVERTKTASRRKRDKEKRARGEKVIIRGQMRMMPNGEGAGDLRPPEATIDLAWLQKRLERLQRRVIRLDSREGKMPEKAKAEGFEKQRARMMEEREALVGFIARMKSLDAEGQFEGSARDQLVDEIKEVLKIDRRRMGGGPGRFVGTPDGAAHGPRSPGRRDDEGMPDPGRRDSARGAPDGRGPKGDMPSGALHQPPDAPLEPGGPNGKDPTSLKGPNGSNGPRKGQMEGNGNPPGGGKPTQLRGEPGAKGKSK
jgi:hypothetical protein